MGTQPDRLDDATDGPRLHQLPRLHGGSRLEPLGEADRVDTPGLLLHPPNLVQLRDRRRAGLIGHHVLAGSHRADAERRAVGRDCGGDDELNGRILENLLSRSGPPHHPGKAEAMGFSFPEIWAHMGWPEIIVAVILFVMGLTSLTVFMERLLTLRRSRRESRRFAAETGGHLRADAIDTVMEEAEKHRIGHLPRLVKAALASYKHAHETA